MKILDASAKKYKLQFNGGNQYIWKYADALRNLPNESSNYRNTDYSIPLLQIVLHGNVAYSSSAVNMAENYEHAILKAIENGENLSYTLAFSNLDKLTSSKHTEYNSVSFEYWKEKILVNDKRISAVLGDTYDKKISKHEYISEEVVKVTYENGVSIIVNYSYEPFDYNGMTIPARDAKAFKS